jgi:HlyD family secretion protein
MQANIAQATANVKDAQRNVDYCTIKSPIKGVILDRRVNIGQTVVSSLNAPSLFLIAKDLTKIQVWVSVNEADSPKIHAGMPVNFTVDGIDRTFKGTVDKMRLNATMTQNVVTYTVEVNADNTDLALIPYRTANVQFLVNEQDNVLLAPNAALRWRPRQTASTGDATTAGTAPASSGTATASATASGTARKGSRGTAATASSGDATKPKPGTVYVLDNGTPRAVKVQTGLTDGVDTAIVGGDLKAGDQIILNYTVSSSGGADSGTTNPFAPQLLRGGRGGGGGGG